MAHMYVHVRMTKAEKKNLRGILKEKLLLRAGGLNRIKHTRGLFSRLQEEFVRKKFGWLQVTGVTSSRC